jgi:ABC-2 type transport system permease protein
MIKTYLIAFLTIIRKECIRFFRIWVQTILPPAITTLLYFLIFGHILGKQIGSIDGFSYIEYIAPGLIMMQVITNAYMNVVSSFYSLRFQKSIEEVIVAPVPNALILLGYVFGGVLRSLIVGAIVAAIALFFTHLRAHDFSVIFFTALLSAILFSLAGFTNALYAKTFDDISIIPTFVLTPLTYLGGIFYSVSFLSPFWQKVSYMNPILYIVNAFRFGVLGISDISLYIAFLILLICCALLFLFNLNCLNRGVGIRT